MQRFGNALQGIQLAEFAEVRSDPLHMHTRQHHGTGTALHCNWHIFYTSHLLKLIPSLGCLDGDSPDVQRFTAMDVPDAYLRARWKDHHDILMHCTPVSHHVTNAAHVVTVCGVTLAPEAVLRSVGLCVEIFVRNRVQKRAVGALAAAQQAALAVHALLPSQRVR